MIGLIKKGIGGFYYVETDKGLIEAKGRGILKKDGITLMVGDNVEISIIDEPEKKGVIEAILPRKIPLSIFTISINTKRTFYLFATDATPKTAYINKRYPCEKDRHDDTRHDESPPYRNQVR